MCVYSLYSFINLNIHPALAATNHFSTQSNLPRHSTFGYLEQWPIVHELQACSYARLLYKPQGIASPQKSNPTKKENKKGVLGYVKCLGRILLPQ